MAARQPRGQWYDWALILGVVALLVVHLAGIVWLIFTSATNLPINDTWQMVEIARHFDQGQLTFEDLWRPRNGHRTLTLRLHTLFLLETTSWNNQIMLLVNLGIVLLTGGLLLIAAGTLLHSTGLTMMVAIPTVIVLLTFGRYHNWLKPFTDKVLTALGVALCVWALAAWPATRWRFGLAVAGALIASLSSSDGLAVWIAFLPVLLVMNRRWTALWTLIGAATIVLYMQGLLGRGTATVSFSMLDTPLYALAYLGAPLAGDSTARAVIAAALGMLVSAINLWIIWRARNGLAPAVWVWPGLALFALGAAGITALGRTGSEASALSSRYQGISPLWWIAVAVVGALAMQQVWRSPGSTRQASGPARRLGIMNLAALGFGVIAAATSSWYGLAQGREWNALARECEVEMREYETASERCLGAYGSARERDMLENMAYLEQRGWAIFRPALADD